MTPTARAILEELGKLTCRSIPELAATTGRTARTVDRALVGLEDQGLVIAHGHGDSQGDTALVFAIAEDRRDEAASLVSRS